MPATAPELLDHDWGKPVVAGDIEVAGEWRIRRWIRARFVRRFGVRPMLVPRGMRALMRLSGVSRAELRAACRSMRTVDDWPSTWQHIADELEQQGAFRRAVIRLHWAQYLLPSDALLKRSLQHRASELYLRCDEVQPATTLHTVHRGYRATTLLQPPADLEAHSLAVIVPGLFDSRERNHGFTQRLREAGVAVARFEMHDVTHATDIEPEGLIEILSVAIRSAAHEVAVPLDRVHIYGTCLGGFYAYHAAAALPIGSLTVVSAVTDATSYVRKLPGNALESVLSRALLDEIDDPLALMARGAIDLYTDTITCPVTIHHGARDTLVPVADATRVASRIASQPEVRLHMFDTHGCPRAFPRIRDAFIASCTNVENKPAGRQSDAA